MPAALPLAEIKNQKLVLIPDTLQRIRQFPPNCKWIGVIGVGRAGKSFLSKHLSGQDFPVSVELQPCTYGVWISEPQRQPNGDYIVYVDSEGTEMGDTSQQHKILSLVCLLLWDGGVLIDNEISYGHGALNALTLLASAHQLIRGVDGNSWPHLCFLLRNMDQPLVKNGVTISTDQFLDHFLTPTNDGRDEDRRLIRECFQRRMHHVFPTPSLEERAAARLPEGRFKVALEALRGRVLSVASLKKIGGILCDGNLLAAFLEECVAKINERGNITMQSAVEATMDGVCSRFANELLANYKSGMHGVLQNLTGDDQPLQTKHSELLAAAINTYHARTQGIFPASVAKYLRILQQQIDAEYALAISTNRAVREEKARVAAEQRAAQERQARINAEQALANANRGGGTFLNNHGFKVGGFRIW